MRRGGVSRAAAGYAERPFALSTWRQHSLRLELSAARWFARIGLRARATDGKFEVAGEVARRLRPVLAAVVGRSIPRFELTGFGCDHGRVIGHERLARLD
jgi:hypothetical protein